jgi:putative transposase
LPCFFDCADYIAYREALLVVAKRADVALHAYVLMTNRVHLLCTTERRGGVSQMMQALGRRYVRYINACTDMVAEAQAYRWSSYRCNALAQPDPLISPHPTYQALGKSTEERAATYRQLCEDCIDAEDLAAIRAHIEQERALGSTRFQDAIEAALKRSVRLRGPGRPRKPKSDRTENVL